MNFGKIRVEGIGDIGNPCNMGIEANTFLICYHKQTDRICFDTAHSISEFLPPLRDNDTTVMRVNITGTNLTCSGSPNGSATAMVTGGIAPYTFSWSTNPIQTTSTLTGLEPGNYVVTVTDANSKTQIANIVIYSPSGDELMIYIENASCGDYNGSAYYNWGGLFGTYKKNLGPGNYVAYKNESVCQVTKRYEIINTNGDSKPILSTTKMNASSCDINDGSATVSVLVGTPPYYYYWDTNPVQRDTTATALSAGTYEVYVTDKNGCSNQDLIFIDCLDSCGYSYSDSIKPIAYFLVDSITDFYVHFKNNTVNGCNYKWYFGDGDSATVLNPSHTYSDTGIYNITLYALAGLRSDTFTSAIHIQIFPTDSCGYTVGNSPKPQAGFVLVSLNGFSVSFKNITLQGCAYTWFFGDGDTSSLLNPTHIYSDTGTFQVILIAFSGDQSDTVSQDVAVYTIGINESSSHSESLEIFPNPSGQTVLVKYRIFENENNTLKISTLNGELIKMYPLESGKNKIEISTTLLKPGLYLCTWVDAQGVTLEYRKMAVVR